MIGASALSDIAGALEEAAGREDLALIEKKHFQFMVQYQTAVGAIRSAFSFDGQSPDDSEILEFQPE